MKVFSKVIIPANAAKTGGTLKDFVWDQLVQGHRVTFENGAVLLQGLDANVQPTFSDLVSIVGVEGSFEGVKLAIQFNNVAAAQQDVPLEIRGSTYIDEEGVEQIRSWIEWFKVNTSTQVITNGTSYAAKAMFNTQLLNSVELTAIHVQVGVSVIEWDVAVALFQDESWTVYEL